MSRLYFIVLFQTNRVILVISHCTRATSFQFYLKQSLYKAILYKEYSTYKQHTVLYFLKYVSSKQYALINLLFYIDDT